MTSKLAVIQTFAPIFVVGASRSGTTLLAVLLDRHSRITITPETQFFAQYLQQLESGHWLRSEQQIVSSALSNQRIMDLNLNDERVIKLLQEYGKSPAGLFRAILECYGEQHNANRIGEKSPRHNEHVDTLLEMFPHAKVIAIVRDGRDVVQSMMSMPWAIPDNGRRFWLFCRDWLVQMRHITRHQRKYGPESHLVVTFRALIRQPEIELKKICEFIDEPFEEQMLSSINRSEAVPDWEKSWKAKAEEQLDTSRLQAWKQESNKRDVWRMNMIMGPMLRRYGYTDTRLTGCPIHYKLWLIPSIILRWEGLYAVVVSILRMSRKISSRVKFRNDP